MADPNDSFLLREYAERQSESAFNELVRRHVNFVYSVAMRYVGNPPDAQDVAQAVFVILARKSAGLCGRSTLTGWLYETTRLTARQLLRTKTRRLAREQEAYMQSTLDPSGGDPLWHQLAPHLEEAMSRLRTADRELLALRFYENKTGEEATALLGIGAAAAHKRTNRALEKLRAFFSRRGVTSTTAIIAGAISSNSVQAAPPGLAETISAAALAKGAAASTSTLTLVKGALKIMAWNKAKTAIAAGVGILLIAGTTTVAVKEIQRRDLDSRWDVGKIDTRYLDYAPHVIRIIPTKFPKQHGGSASFTDQLGDEKMIGIADDPQDMIQAVWGVGATRIIYSTALPNKKFDFVSNLPSGPIEALQRSIEKKFSITVRRETRETNVLFLRVTIPDAPGLRPTSTHNGSSSRYGANQLSLVNGPAISIAGYVESQFGVPVLDQTGLKGSYDINLKWRGNDPQHEKFKQLLREQLGLELVPGTAPVEMLVVEKVK